MKEKELEKVEKITLTKENIKEEPLNQEGKKNEKSQQKTQTTKNTKKKKSTKKKTQTQENVSKKNPTNMRKKEDKETTKVKKQEENENVIEDIKVEKAKKASKKDIKKEPTNAILEQKPENELKSEIEQKQEEILKIANNEKKEEVIQKEQQEIVQKEQQEEIKNKQQEETKEELQTIETEEELPKEDIPTKKSKKATIIITIISILLLVAVMVFSTIFALLNKASNKIVEGICVKGIDISGLTQEEATTKLNEVFSENLKKNITLTCGEFETSLTPEQIEMKYDVQQAIESAYAIGRTGNILKDNYTILHTHFSKVEITPTNSYNEELLTNFIISTEGNLPNILKQSSYSIDGKKLIIDKGQKGTGIQKEVLKKQILDTFSTIEEAKTTIEIPTIEQLPEKIDLMKIRNEIYKEPKDAYYTKNPFTIYPHVNGVDFGISMEEAQNLLDTTTETTVTIPLNITVPKVTTNHIGTEAFPNLLATYSTTFSTSNSNRTTNIRLATNKVNGVVLLPGETFSYNKVVGQRTAAAGYKTAAVYVGGRVENGIGGGICQVSSTLYNTALRANLEIVRRSNHRFATGYVPLSTDATVSWGGPDFVFKNSRKYPIKIVASVNGGKITVSMYGCKEENEYEVVIQSQTLRTIPMKTVYKTNPALPKGTTKTVQKGHGGYQSRAYRILKQNGSVVSKQLLSTDTYAQLETIIEQNP
ncbi:MAG: hypothetical protein HFJ27_01840 [Clostridia bacterium]|nr:hypothetical protein [Clostridia bacterium]